MLDTALTRLLGIDHAVVQAGMGYLALQELAAAVSEAGGLGVLGSTGSLTPDQLRDEVRAVRRLTRRPFAVNLLFPRYDRGTPVGARLAEELRAKVDVVVAEGVPVLGVPDAWVFDACRAAGVRTMCTVGATRHAEKAQAAGADILVAQGWEAGGHNSRVATMALLPQICRIARVPVVAAGGIAGGAGLVAALALGASGVYLGTVFATSREARAQERSFRCSAASNAPAAVCARDPGWRWSAAPRPHRRDVTDPAAVLRMFMIPLGEEFGWTRTEISGRRAPRDSSPRRRSSGTAT